MDGTRWMEPDGAAPRTRPPMNEHDARANLILGMLPPGAYQRIAPHLQTVSLRAGEVLFSPETDAPLQAIHFLAGPIVSFDHVLGDSEHHARLVPSVAITGREGVAGVELFLGGQTAINRATVRVGGAALRLQADPLRHEFARGTVLQRLLLGAADALLSQIAYNSACERLHTPTQRLVRWLLLVDDRALQRELPLTQETLAQFMGLRRESVSLAARQLQGAGLIRYSRGHLAILDRDGLLARSCVCYTQIKARYDATLAAG